MKRALSSIQFLVPTALTFTEYKFAGINVFTVTRLLPETAKNPAAFLVKIKLADSPTRLLSSRVSFPTTAPATAFVETVRLVMLIIKQSPNRGRLISRLGFVVNKIM